MKTKDTLRTAVQQFTKTLDDAQSPACWQEEITHESRKLKQMPTACAWAEEPLAEAPTLLPEPIFGQCLEEVIAPRQAEAAPQAAQPPRRSQPRRQEGDSQQSAAPRRQPSDPSSRRPVDSQSIPVPVYRHRLVTEMPEQGSDSEHVLGLPSEAEATLLNRLCQDEAAGQVGAGASGRRASHPMNDGRTHEDEARTNRPKPRAARQDRPAADGQHMQTETLQQRVAATLTRTARATFGEVPDVDAQTFSTGWDALVGEHDLPAGFLAGLVTPAAQHATGSDSMRSTQQPRDERSDTPQSRSGINAEQGSNRRHTTPAGMGEATEMSQPIQTHSQHPGLPLANALNRLEETLGYTAGASGVAASDALAPHDPLPVTPAITPTPMITPPRVEQSVPAIATATVWRGAQAETPTVSVSDDDLPRLAELMKRILDADARRHGIDV